MAEEINAPSSAEKVFNTFELVEAILLNTCNARARAKKFRANARMTLVRPITDHFEARGFKRRRKCKLLNKMEVDHYTYAQELRDLFQMQRVNTTFRNVIAGSKELRQNMLKEAPVTPIRKLRSEFWDDEDELVRHINPVAFEFDKFLSFRAFDFSFDSYSEHEEAADLEVNVALHGAFEEPSKTASWRSMLFTRAPISCEVAFTVRTELAMYTQYEAELKAGATLGDFVDAVKKAIEGDNWLDFGSLELSELS